jgi:hypothetical protein
MHRRPGDRRRRRGYPFPGSQLRRGHFGRERDRRRGRRCGHLRRSHVAEPPSVLVEDEFGNAVAGVTVTFAVASGGGSVSEPVQTTGDNGAAFVGGWTLGPDLGENTLTATADGLAGSPVTSPQPPSISPAPRRSRCGTTTSEACRTVPVGTPAS